MNFNSTNTTNLSTTGITTGIFLPSTTGIQADFTVTTNDSANEALTVFLSVVGCLVLGGFVSKLLWRYADFKRTEWYALVTTWINWFMAVSILVLIPIDVSSVRLFPNFHSFYD